MQFSDAETIDNIFRIIEVVKSEKVIVGEVHIRDENGELYDKFHVRIVFNPKLKYNFPKVSEIGYSIPWIADRHVNRDGTFCLAFPHEEIEICKSGISFRDFIQNVLYKYLVNQSLINNGKIKSFLMGEHAHNEQGIVDHYQKLFPGFTTKKIIHMVNYAKHHLVSKTSKHMCPCAGKSLMIICHFRELAEVKSYGKKRIALDLLNLVKSSI